MFVDMDVVGGELLLIFFLWDNLYVLDSEIV